MNQMPMNNNNMNLINQMYNNNNINLVQQQQMQMIPNQLMFQQQSKEKAFITLCLEKEMKNHYISYVIWMKKFVM